tara:strand:- start:56 stop:514 length:459 start_codon:yes stop_codon:yes gene_type:complete
MRWYHCEEENLTYKKKGFILKKESHVRCKKHLESLEFRMSLLRQKKFKKIKIPDFTYRVDGSIITYEIEFIKGTQLKIENVHKYYDIIKSDLIYTGEDYGFADFSLENFIIQINSRDLYFVDFEDFVCCDDFDRWKLWNEHRRRDITAGFWK